jgi:HlyD family secretion protein
VKKTRQTRKLLGAVLLALAVAGCGSRDNQGWQGWVEADLIFVSPDESGRLTKLLVREGDTVTPGTPLYELDDDIQQADFNQQQAQLVNAQQTFDRAQQLAKTGSGTQRDFDAAQSALRVAQARVNTSQTQLARRKLASPVGGVIQQIYFREGEMVGASKPVAAILPPDNVKIRFYVQETELPKIAIGAEVRVSCDGCAPNLAARVYFIASNAEYTPPVIYSESERSKLVYLVQARPAQPGNFRIGQPVTVTASQ